MRSKSAPPQRDGAVAELAATQHGVVAAQQLSRLGLSRGAIARWSRAGRLHPIHRGVYAVGHSLVSVEGRWLAAVLACGDGSVLSHRTAAALWDIRRTASPRIDVSVPGRGGRHRRPGFIVHRPRGLPAVDITSKDEIPVTTVARTLLDLAGVVAESSLTRALERAEALRLFDLGALRAVLSRNPNASGAGLLAGILDRQYADVVLTRTDLEDRFLALCEDHGLPRPLVNAWVLQTYEVDFLWREQGVIVEVDGHETHGTRTAFEHDRARDARLVAAGYRVLRFTHRQLATQPETVAEMVRAVLAQRPAGYARSISSIR